MKKHQRITKWLLGICLLILLTVSAAGAVSAETVKVKPKKYTRIAAKADEAAIAAKKGTIKVKIGSSKNACGYIRFKAPQKGKYRFTIKNVQPVHVKKDADRRLIGHVTFLGVSNESFLKEKKVSTRDGKTNTLNLATAEAYAAMQQGKSQETAYLCSRSGTLKLKKNEYVYLFFTFTKQVKAELTIEKR